MKAYYKIASVVKKTSIVNDDVAVLIVSMGICNCARFEHF